MFDSEEIAQRVMLRVKEIEAQKKQRRKRIRIAGVLCSMCAAVLVLSAVLFQPAALFSSNTPEPYIIVDDQQIPLAEPLLPDENEQNEPDNSD